jgi:hypothetical protein
MLDIHNAGNAPQEYISKCTFTQSLCDVMNYDFFTLAMAIFLIPFYIFVLVLFVSHLYLITINQTTNEQANFYRFEYMMHPADLDKPFHDRRYMNPFDYGVIGNWKEFLYGKNEFEVDYSKTYRVPIEILRQEKYRSTADLV